MNGTLENSVRFRLPSRTFKVTATAIGPGGSRSFTSTFTTPKPPGSQEARKVLTSLEKEKTPPVFAVGATKTLTGESKACAPMTIWSDEQKASGCFKPVEALGDIPPGERGVLDTLANELGLQVTDTALMERAVGLTDGYVSRGRTLLNDEFPVTPTGARGSGASASATGHVVFDPHAKAVVSADADLPIGGTNYSPKKGFNLKVDPKKVKIALGKHPNPPKLPSLAGLEIVGDWDVSLDKEEAKIKASVKLPPAIKKAGVQISNQVNLRATKDRVIVDAVRIGPIDVDVASLSVNKFQIAYDRAANQWKGQGKACVVDTACLDMIPPAGGVTIRNGDLAEAGATLGFPPPGLPLFTGVNLERIGFGIALRPTRINANARVGVGQLLKLDGRVLFAFPDSANPFILTRAESGNGYPGHLYGQKFTRTTVGATAEAFLQIPVIGETRLANAYVLYEYPGYAAFGGGFDAELAGILSVKGGVAAEADFDQAIFNVHGSVRSCIHLIADLCQGAVANVSRGRGGTGGAGACVEVGPFNIGGGLLWKGPEVLIWPLDGCKWSRFRTTVRSSAVRTAQAGGRYTITVKEGERSRAVQLDGAGAAPVIRVSGPGGQVLETRAGSGFSHTPDGAIRVMRFENPQTKSNMAVVGLQDAKPGTYTVETLPGSAPIAGVKQAMDPPDAKVTGKVRGKQRRRVLTYNVRPRASQRVTFQELGPGGVSKRIGTVTGGRGRLGFTSAPGRGRRRVIAQFELNGMPAERKLVTRFKPQSPLLAKPRRVRVRRKGTRLLVSWPKVKGATRYEVAGSLSSRRQRFATTRRGRATLKRVPRYLGGRVTVRAVDDLRQSKLAGRRFKQVARPPSGFRTLPKCKVTKRKINCGKGSAKRRTNSKKRKPKSRRA